MDALTEILKKAKTDELDYLFILDCLSDYKNPRAKITSLLKKGDLIRVKKGIYVLGKSHRKRPYSLEVLANQIYGPSYISFEYALSFYGLIPEKVTRVTSACSKRNKDFKTPVGDFVYYYISLKKYTSGIRIQSIDENTHFLIATPEKALSDYLARIKPFQNKNELLIFLTESMRIEESELYKLKTSNLREISSIYKNKNMELLCQILRK